MTNKDKAFFRRFLELNIKKAICQLWIAAQRDKKFADELSDKILEVTAKSDEIDKQIGTAITENSQLFISVNLDAIAKQEANWVTEAKQRAFAKDLIGEEVTVEELIARNKK